MPTPLAKQTVRKFGYLRGHPVRYVKGHSGWAEGQTNDRPISKRHDLWKREDRGYQTRCWIWQGSLTEGYGRITHRYTRWMAHRLIYEQEIGPLAADLQIDHLCCQRACINPEHLEAVTAAENSRRSNATKLTWADVETIRASNGRIKDLAAQFGVNRGTISRIRHRHGWLEP